MGGNEGECFLRSMDQVVNEGRAVCVVLVMIGDVLAKWDDDEMMVAVLLAYDRKRDT